MILLHTYMPFIIFDTLILFLYKIGMPKNNNIKKQARKTRFRTNVSGPKLPKPFYESRKNTEKRLRIKAKMAKNVRATRKNPTVKP
jgi:hypothetical protein